MKTISYLGIFIVCFVVTQPPAGTVETAKSADAFVDSVGVNVHLHDSDTLYAQFDSVETALTNLGVRHIRDGLIDTTWTPYYDRLNELGSLGIKSTLITNPAESNDLLTGYPQRVSDSFEAYEGPNEYDASGDPNWAATLNSFMARLYGAVKSNPNTARFPVFGPSLTQPGSYPQVAASAPFFDDANLHNYFGGRNPGTPGWGNNGYGSIGWNLALVQSAWPCKPIVTTETGYLNDLSNPQGIPEQISGRYLPRVLFEQWNHGIEKTFIYQLLEEGSQFPDNSFGLVHSDFTPKPGYTAIENLLHLLSDPGPAVALGSLDYSLSGNLGNIHHTLLEKRNGVFYLAVWVEAPAYDVNAKKILPVATQTVTLQFKQTETVKSYVLDDEGGMTASTLGSGQTQTISVNDRVTVL